MGSAFRNNKLTEIPPEAFESCAAIFFWHGMNYLCDAFSWNAVNIPLVTWLFFVYTLAKLSKIKSLVGSWISQYTTRKHRITSLYEGDGNGNVKQAVGLD